VEVGDLKVSRRFDGLGVFGMVTRGAHHTEPDLVVVEMLTSQTSTQMRMGAAKIDAMSFVYDLDCATMRYRLNHQVSYERTGQPVMQTNLNNAMIEGPMASYLQFACGQTVPDGLQLGEVFSSMEGFLSAADPILEPRLANLPRPSIILTPRRSQN
jgi:hypothetical protein